MSITVKIHHLAELREALAKFPKETARYLEAAGRESASKVILPTEGLKKYPPASEANRPPTPYYIRGRGMQYASRNDYKSERLGTQFYSEATSPTVTEIGNRASYARYVVDLEYQAGGMRAHGWRTLAEVAEEKIAEITRVYDLWIDKLLKDIGL